MATSIYNIASEIINFCTLNIIFTHTHKHTQKLYIYLYIYIYTTIHIYLKLYTILAQIHVHTYIYKIYNIGTSQPHGVYYGFHDSFFIGLTDTKWLL